MPRRTEDYQGPSCRRVAGRRRACVGRHGRGSRTNRMAYRTRARGQAVKLLVFIAHDIICRHIVLNGALDELVRNADIRFGFPDDARLVNLVPETLPLGAAFVRLPIDARRQLTWRWLLFASQLRPRRGKHEAAVRRIRWMTLGWKAATLLTLGGLPGGASVLRLIAERRFKRWPNRELAALLDRERPDAIFHPTVLDGVFVNDLVLEGKRRAIPVVFAIKSWGNPSTKQTTVNKPKYQLVWGQQTREHAIRFMTMAEKDVLVFGAAQFDVFAEPARINRTEFCG